jgi:hypothetical protein
VGALIASPDSCANYIPPAGIGPGVPVVLTPLVQRSVAESKRGQYIPCSKHISAVAALCPNTNVRDVAL